MYLGYYNNSPQKRAARGWILAYQATSIDLTLQSHTLDPTSGLSFLRLVVPI